MDNRRSNASYTKEQVEVWIQDARNGCTIALGQLVNASQAYLRSVAIRRLPNALNSKVSPSDLVQDTALDAHRDFTNFQGERLEELLAWLRQILLHNQSSSSRHFERTAKRGVSREISGDWAANAFASLGADAQTPSCEMVSRERQYEIEKVLSQLPDKMKTVIELRNKENLSFAEIGVRIQCSTNAASKLWARAIERMQQLLLNNDGEP